MFGLFVLGCTVVAGVLWWNRKPAARQDILEQAKDDLKDAQTAREAAEIRKETNKIINETKEM